MLYLSLIIISCDSDDNKRTITHEILRFDKEIKDTLRPIKGKYYGAKSIYIKGFVDDSIYVSFGENHYKFFLNKKIDTIISMDYYGVKEAIFNFNPHKAKKGNLKIQFKI